MVTCRTLTHQEHVIVLVVDDALVRRFAQVAATAASTFVAGTVLVLV